MRITNKEKLTKVSLILRRHGADVVIYIYTHTQSLEANIITNGVFNFSFLLYKLIRITTLLHYELKLQQYTRNLNKPILPQKGTPYSQTLGGLVLKWVEGKRAQC